MCCISFCRSNSCSELLFNKRPSSPILGPQPRSHRKEIKNVGSEGKFRGRDHPGPCAKRLPPALAKLLAGKVGSYCRASNEPVPDCAAEIAILGIARTGFSAPRLVVAIPPIGQGLL